MFDSQWIKDNWAWIAAGAAGLWGAYKWAWTTKQATDDSQKARESAAKERLWSLMDESINRMETKISDLRLENEEHYKVETELRTRCSTMAAEMLEMKSQMFRMKHDLDVVMHHHTQAEAEVRLWRDAYGKLADAFNRGRPAGVAQRHVDDMQQAIARALMPQREVG